MSIFDEIKIWNEDRGLLEKDFNLYNEMCMAQEEIIEATTPLQSDEARELAKSVVSKFMKPNDVYMPDDEQIVDAMCDVIVYVTGTMLKKGYNPNKCMSEALKEISSRKGSIIDGKFVKDKSEEAQALWYKADFTKCKLD